MYEALEHLAAPAPEQVAYLRKLGSAPCADELALELNDEVVMVPQFVGEGLLSHRQAELVQAVDEKLDEMSGMHQAHLWDEDALLGRPEWEEVRRLAAAALAELDKH